MAGVSTILKLIGGTLFLLVLVFVAAVGTTLVGPIYENVINPSEMTALGWGAPQDTVLLFMSLGMVGLGLVVIVWWVLSPIQEDVRQDQQRRF